MSFKRILLVLTGAVVIGVAIGITAIVVRREPPVITPPIVGGDVDAHGCLGSAGYTWCEAKSECLRTWETPCSIEDSLRNYLRDHLAELSPEPEVLGGKFYVTALSLIGGDRATVEYEDGHNAWHAVFRYRIADEIVIDDFRLADSTVPSDMESR